MCSTVCALQADISQCASSAVKGFEAWSGLSCYQRSKVLLRYSEWNPKRGEGTVFQRQKKILQTFLCMLVDLSTPMHHWVRVTLSSGWRALLASMARVWPSCATCLEPPAPPPALSGCCSTTAARLSSETLLSPTGRHWVREPALSVDACFPVASFTILRKLF